MQTFVASIKLQRSKRNYLVAVTVDETFVNMYNSTNKNFANREYLLSMELVSQSVSLLKVFPSNKFVAKVFESLTEDRRVVELDSMFGPALIESAKMETFSPRASIMFFNNGTFKVRFENIFESGKQFIWESDIMSFNNGVISVEAITTSEVSEATIDVQDLETEQEVPAQDF
jgi:hypothetical protein